MKMKPWHRLKKGDVVDVIAPGYATSREAIEGARRFLTSWGLIPRIPKDLIAPHFLHSQDDQIRFLHLKRALLSNDSAGVWCLRGGYGSNRLLPELAKIKAPMRAKLFIGISDVTSLHVFLNQKWRWQTIHGPLLERMGFRQVKPRYERELKDLVFGKNHRIEFAGLKPLNESARKARSLKGGIVGGNLTVLQSLIGTPWNFQLKDRFLFIEDLGERGYRVDRMLEQIRQIGEFKKCKGLLIGDFLGGDDPNGSNLIYPVLRRFASENKLPVWSGLQAGHGTIQRPLPLGTMAKLVGGSRSRLIIESGVKE